MFKTVKIQLLGSFQLEANASRDVVSQPLVDSGQGKGMLNFVLIPSIESY